MGFVCRRAAGWPARDRRCFRRHRYRRPWFWVWIRFHRRRRRLHLRRFWIEERLSSFEPPIERNQEEKTKTKRKLIAATESPADW